MTNIIVNAANRPEIVFSRMVSGYGCAGATCQPTNGVSVDQTNVIGTWFHLARSREDAVDCCRNRLTQAYLSPNERASNNQRRRAGQYPATLP
ncbi:hypothetical protein [Paracoccus indicus]|uniref:hypothetical protein n=1 Tax=Paracoccus indicus TaxID=2079229 RepID=UPI0013B37255|nr:hypothetical protein [Paracoccus indicus]